MEVLVWSLTIFGLVGLPIILASVLPYEWLDGACIMVNAILIFIITQQLLEIVVALISKPVRSFTSSGYKPITVIIPAYLPNEKDIILDTLDSYVNLSYHGAAGKNFNVILAYNTPKDMPEVEKKIADYEKKNQGWLKCYKVPGSRTKAQNINYVLDNHQGLNEIIGLFDADHHPYPDTLMRGNYWLIERGYDFVQGRCKVRPNTSLLSYIVSMNFDLMYCIQHQFRKVVFDIGIFGGSDGFWKRDVLSLIKFNPSMLTEDINCTVEAIKMGYKGTYDVRMVSTEESPPSLKALFRQRGRWSLGWLQVSIKHFRVFFTAPGYSLWQRIGLVNLFIIRELFSHVVLLCLPFLSAKIIWEAPPDLFAGLTMFYSLVTYPLTVVASLVASYEIYHQNLYLIPISVLGSVLWIYFEQLVMMMAKVKLLLRQTEWVVTKRS